MLESVVSARGKVLRTNFSATSRVTRATKLTQAACAFYLFIARTELAKLLIYGLFRKIRVLAQDDSQSWMVRIILKSGLN